MLRGLKPKQLCLPFLFQPSLYTALSFSSLHAFCCFSRFLKWLNFQVASFLLYLSDVDEGGETMFPFEVRIMETGSNSFSNHFSWIRIYLGFDLMLRIATSAEWIKYGYWLWLWEVHRVKGETASRRWPFVLFPDDKWYNRPGISCPFPLTNFILFWFFECFRI